LSGLLVVSLTVDDVPGEGFGKLKRDVAVEPKEGVAPEENENGEAGCVTFFDSANPSELDCDWNWNTECAFFVRARDDDSDAPGSGKKFDAFDAASELVGTMKAGSLASLFGIGSLAALKKGVWRMLAELGLPNEDGDIANGPSTLGFPKVVESDLKDENGDGLPNGEMAVVGTANCCDVPEATEGLDDFVLRTLLLILGPFALGNSEDDFVFLKPSISSSDSPDTKSDSR